MGDLSAALADLESAEAYVPDEPGVPFGRGLVAWAAGDTDGAFTLLRAGLAAAGPEVRAGFWTELERYPRRDDLRRALDKGVHDERNS
jgi:hypothetical protein